MTRQEALRKYMALSRMTMANGCTEHEASTARELAERLNSKWHFQTTMHEYTSDAAFDSMFRKAETAAAQHFHWEYRRCGKHNCHCYHDQGHGPYKYAKKRKGKYVTSVYLGK